MKTLPLFKALLSSLSIATLCQGSPAIRELVLPNMAGNLPFDPLPPLRQNHPSAKEMVQTPKAHPYLFFTQESRNVLRERIKDEPFRSLAERIRKHADECAAREIPPQATMRDLPMHLPDGSYNPEYAKEEYANQFFAQSYLMREEIPTLGFAYQLTGEAKYAEAGKKWLMTYAARKKFTPTGREADFHIAQVMYAFSLGYDWLYEVLNDSERAQIRGLLTQLSGPMHEAGQKILTQSVNRGSMGGNHFRRTHGMFALTPLVLLYEVPAAQGWLDTELQVQRDRLYPSGYSPDGEYQDAWDHYKSSIDDPMPFAVALQRMGGENLFKDSNLGPRFRGMPYFFLYGLESRVSARKWNDHGWSGKNEPDTIYSWLALASELKDPVAQWIATRDNGLDKIDEVLAYLLYDPAVKPAAPIDPPASVYFPYSGLVKMATGWGADDILLTYRCGMRLAVDRGDQNGFRLRVGDDWLVPRLNDAGHLPEQTDEFNYDLMGWFWGSAAQNVVVADPAEIADYLTYKKSGKIPVGGGVQYSTYTKFKYDMADKPPGAPVRQVVYENHEEWQTGPRVSKTGDLRVVTLGANFDYVCGEVHRSYYFFQPALSLRHMLFVKGDPGRSAPYVLICDEIESDATPRTFAWQIHAGGPMTLEKDRLQIAGSHSGLSVNWLYPTDGSLIRKQSPAPIPDERTEFAQYVTAKPEPRAVFMTALVVQTPGAKEHAPTMRMIPAEGGWAVEVSDSEGTKVALFRSEHASKVSAAGVSSKGTAALLQRPNQGESVVYSLGSP